jgi:hypothetical protein
MAKLDTGQVAVTGTAAALSTSSLEHPFTQFRAPSTNVGVVYWGLAGVTTATGHALEPGEVVDIMADSTEGGPFVDLQVQDIYVVGTAGDKVTWASGGR